MPLLCGRWEPVTDWQLIGYDNKLGLRCVQRPVKAPDSRCAAVRVEGAGFDIFKPIRGGPPSPASLGILGSAGARNTTPSGRQVVEIQDVLNNNFEIPWSCALCSTCARRVADHIPVYGRPCAPVYHRPPTARVRSPPHPPPAKPPARAGGFGYSLIETLLVAGYWLVGFRKISRLRQRACRQRRAGSPTARRPPRAPCLPTF